MTRNHFVLRVQPHDADPPGYYDLHLDTGKLGCRFRGDPCVDRLCRKMEMTRGEVLATFTPGAYLDQATGEVNINAGYDPRFDEGVLEALIWSIVQGEVSRILGSRNPAAEVPPAIEPSARPADHEKDHHRCIVF